MAIPSRKRPAVPHEALTILEQFRRGQLSSLVHVFILIDVRSVILKLRLSYHRAGVVCVRNFRGEEIVRPLWGFEFCFVDCWTKVDIALFFSVKKY